MAPFSPKNGPLVVLEEVDVFFAALWNAFDFVHCSHNASK